MGLVVVVVVGVRVRVRVVVGEVGLIKFVGERI